MWFDPSDLIAPLGLHDRHLLGDGQGAVLWIQGLHEEGAAIGFQAMSLVDRPPVPTDPEPPQLQLPRMTVEQGEHLARIPALRGDVHSVDHRLFKLQGAYYVRVPDRTVSLRCSVVVHDVELALEFCVDELR